MLNLGGENKDILFSKLNRGETLCKAATPNLFLIRSVKGRLIMVKEDSSKNKGIKKNILIIIKRRRVKRNKKYPGRSQFDRTAYN